MTEKRRKSSRSAHAGATRFKSEQATTDGQRKTKGLTRREKALFAGLARGMSITDAARAAGYSQKWPGQAGHQALENIKQKAPNLFERHGLDDDTFIEKHIIPALNATEVKVFQNKGKLIYSKPLIVWGPRIATNRLVAEMKGMIVREQEGPKEGIRVVMINQVNRLPRPAPKPPIDIPGLTYPVKPS